MAIALKLPFYYALNLKVMSLFSEPAKQRILKYEYSLPPFIIGNENHLQERHLEQRGKWGSLFFARLCLFVLRNLSNENFKYVKRLCHIT